MVSGLRAKDEREIVIASLIGEMCIRGYGESVSIDGIALWKRLQIADLAADVPNHFLDATKKVRTRA